MFAGRRILSLTYPGSLGAPPRSTLPSGHCPPAAAPKTTAPWPSGRCEQIQRSAEIIQRDGPAELGMRAAAVAEAALASREHPDEVAAHTAIAALTEELWKYKP